MKTYYIMISKQFMKGHPRAGQPTNFREQIEFAVSGKRKVVTSTWVDTNNLTRTRAELSEERGKIHTIRGNYEHWAHVADEVNAGRGILSLRQWTGSPYNFQRDGSKQEEFLQLTKMGVQRVSILKGKDFCYIDGQTRYLQSVSTNDGLSRQDFDDWFKKPLIHGAIIHFTDFRY